MDIITIDGLSGTGKTARALDLAEKLKYNYIGIGYIFRAIAYLNIYSHYSKINNLKYSCSIIKKSKRFCVTLDNEDITDLLHGDYKIDEYCASHSQDKDVLKYVKETLTNIMDNGNWVVEGRSAANFFPHARMKFILTCEKEERKKRIIKEMMRKGLTYQEANIIFIKSEKRNYADVCLSSNPFRSYANTIIINSTYLNPQETLYTMMDYCLSNSYIFIFSSNKIMNYIDKKCIKVNGMKKKRIYYQKYNSNSFIVNKNLGYTGTINEHFQFHAYSNELIVKDKIFSSGQSESIAYFVSNLHQHINVSIDSDIQSIRLISQYVNKPPKNIPKKEALTYNFFADICKNAIQKNKNIYKELINWCEKNSNFLGYEILTFLDYKSINSDLLLLQDKYHNTTNKPMYYIVITNQDNLKQWLIIIQTIISDIPVICIDKELIEL